MGKRERMSRKLDSWLGRSFKAAKLNALLNLTVSRLAVLRNQRRVRCDHAHSDVAELLRQGQQERALLRAEYVIKEENMLDAFAMVESYCLVVTERSTLLENQNQKECPEELREAIAGLIFAESRCGELPELHKVRFILASRLGKEFVAAAVELRNNCGVNSRIIQKMSTKQASLESRTKVTKDIAAELGIALHLEEAEEPSSELPTQPPSSTPKQPDAAADAVVSEFARDEFLSESVNVRERYKSAASAAQAAFESAAYAAAAARAAVELSRSASLGKVSRGNQSSRRAPARSTSGGRSYPVQSSGSETESEKEMEQSVKPVPFPAEREKRMEDDASEEDDEESEEEGVGRELMGNRPSPMQSRAPGSRNRPEYGFQGQREIGVRSDEDTSSEEEEEEIKPQMAAFRRRSPARQQGSWEGSPHRELNRAADRYRKGGEQREREEEEDTVTHGSERPTGRHVAGRVPVNRLGVEKGPASMRTRRSGF